MTEKEKELHQQALNEIEKHKEKVEADPHRQAFHLMPPVGLLNDPNGWIQWNGTYHMFYQWNPFTTDHGSKFWGHYSSADLVNWKAEPIAIAPSEWYEKNGCYSGSAVDADGKLALVYTGNVKDANGNRESYQCVATSDDGVTFHKEGPVIDELPEGYTAHFRDPKVWRENGTWYMVIGAQTTDLKGQVLLYASENLSEWEFRGPLAGSGIGSLRDFGYMWECPDLFSLDGKEVLVVSPQGLEQEGIHYQNIYQAGYFIGEANLESPAFHHGDFAELDHGFEFYAPQTTEDEQGRRILTGWMGVPEQDEEYHPTVKHNWVHCLTIPRELRVVDGRLIQRPVEELKALRKDHIEHRHVTVGDKPAELEGVSGKTAEVFVEAESGVSGILEVSLRDEARLIYNPEKSLLTLERTNMRTRLTEQRHARIERLENVRLFMDNSSLEFFINDGETVMTARYFPEPDNSTITFKSAESVVLNVEKWRL